ncbi:MAG: hypothetical protein WCI18_17020, partial [Pseudomonadota bacterium]
SAVGRSIISKRALISLPTEVFQNRASCLGIFHLQSPSKLLSMVMSLVEDERVVSMRRCTAYN